MRHEPRDGYLNGRGFVSFLLASFSTLAFVTGIVLYVTPQGRIAHWTDWSLMGLRKDEWSALHINIGFVFVIAAVLHLYLNWRIFWSYIKSRTASGFHLGREAAVALVVTLLVATGSYFSIPPFSTVVIWNDDIKTYWVRTSPHPPYPHAEDSTLEEFATRLGLRLDDLERALRQNGFHVPDTEVTVAAVAIRNELAPSDLYSAISKHHPSIEKPRRNRRK